MICIITKRKWVKLENFFKNVAVVEENVSSGNLLACISKVNNYSYNLLKRNQTNTTLNMYNNDNNRN